MWWTWHEGRVVRSPSNEQGCSDGGVASCPIIEERKTMKGIKTHWLIHHSQGLLNGKRHKHWRAYEQSINYCVIDRTYAVQLSFLFFQGCSDSFRVWPHVPSCWNLSAKPLLSE